MAALPEIAGAVACLVLLTVCRVTGFNLDTEFYTRYRGDEDSMFGFTVALHRESGTSSVLVGAPQAQTSQEGIVRGGAVYKCDISNDDHCAQIAFDRTGNHFGGKESRQLDDKSNQWFGAALYSAGEDKPVVACAPRYTYNGNSDARKEPVGTCFLARNMFTEFLEFAPCRTNDHGYHKQGMCQAALGVAISRDGERLFIGAVGSRYWQGELYSINDTARLPFTPPRFTTINEEGMIVSQSTHNRIDVSSTPEGPYTDDDTYLGYSMTVGDFGGYIAGHGDVAVGRPRADGLRGQVLLFTWNLTNLQNISGEQLGSYFGYSLTTSDVDGDGRDDLIIGAPLYTHLENNEGKYETGRVYVLYQGRSEHARFNSVHTRDGKNSKGRFGLSLTSLRDINKDGFGDFAVGAPYDGPDERGAVYIFHGSAEGVRESHSQVIYAEEIVGAPQTFGFSLSGGIDLDENEYPDLVVGAYDSNTAVFLRARPVVTVDATINFISEGKQIALEERNCTLRDRSKVPCIQIKSCLQYNGIGVGRRLDFEVQFVLDAKKPKNPRMFFITDEGRNIRNQSLRLTKGQQTCSDMFVYLKSNIRDKLTSLDAEIRYSLLGNYTQSQRRAKQLSPVLDLNEDLSRRDSIIIMKNCGKDNICIPDLRLIAQPSVKRYLLGSGERFHLNILVQNEGEDAFEAVFETSVPPGMNYVKIERLDDAEREIPVQCSPPSFVNNNTLRCDIGNPLPKEKLVQFNIIMQPFHQDGMSPRYEFEMKVNSTNPENKTSVSDNLKHITVPIWVETDLILQGSSNPADVHYNSSLYYKTDNFTHESEIGPQVIHVYGIRNKGPSDIEEAEAVFLWPSYTLAGDHLLYLLEQPETLGNINCDYVEEANVRHITLDRKRKPFLGHSDEVGIQAGWSKAKESESTSSSSGVHESHVSSETTYSHSSGRVITTEERRKIEEAAIRKEEEEALRETGDGSYRQGQRVRNKIKEEHSHHYSSNGGRLESDSHSRPTVYVHERGRVEVSKTPVVSDKSYFEHSSHSHAGERQGTDIIVGAREQGRGGHVHYEEKEETSNTTWTSGQKPKTVISTRWKNIDDGVEKSGSSTRVHSGGSANINLADLALSDAGNRRYTIGSSGGGGKLYSEERHYEKNTTWDSQRGPKVTESSSWKTNEDGVVREGSSHSGSTDDRRVAGSTQHESRGRVSGVGEAVNRGSSRHETTVSHHVHGSSYDESSNRDSARRVNVNQGQGSNRHVSEHRNQDGESERRTHYQEERRQNTGGSFSSEHRQTFGGRAHNEDGINYEGSRTIITHGQQSGDGVRHGTRVEGASNRRITEDERVATSESSGRRNEGRHRVHWSSGTNVDDADDYRGTANVESDIRRVVGAGSNIQGSNRDKVYTEEHHREWNTTWDSEHGGKPKTTEFTKWSVNEDGTIRNGSHVDSYEGSAKIDKDFDKHLIVTSVGSGGINVDQNLIRTGNKGTVYSEEKETSYNTTWNLATGGRPITQTRTNWKVNQDGVVRSGSKADVYEGTAPPLHGSSDEIQGSVGSRRQESSYASRHEETRHGGIDGHSSQRGSYSGSHQQDYERSGVSATSISRGHEESRGSHGSEHSERHESSHGSEHNERREGSYGMEHSGRREGSYGSEHSGRREGSYGTEHNRRGGSSYGSEHSGRREGSYGSEHSGRREGSYGTEQSERREGSHHHTAAANVNVGDLLKAQGQGSQSSGSMTASFNHFGEIAKGPKDGVAKTHTLDLGINSGNAGSSSGSSHHSHSGHHSSSGNAESQGRHYSSEDSRGSSYRNEGSQGYSYRNQDRLESSSHSTWSQGSADGDNPQHGGAYAIRKVTDAPYPRHISDESTKGKFQLYPRYKRQAGNEDLEKSLNCGPTDCTRIRCTLGPLKKDEEAWVAFRSRVWVSTIRKISSDVEVGLSSLVAARVTKLPHIGSPDVVTTHSHEVHSQIMPPETAVKPDIIPLWIVVVSACAGAIILMLLVYLLYKCGFFKRNRPSSAPEKQPLNRNGHYHGDEAL